jgi:PAS domain-containing protein
MKTHTSLLLQPVIYTKAMTRIKTWHVYVGTLLFGALVLVADMNDHVMVFTPMVGFWWLMLIAFFRRSSEVAIVGAILLFFVVCSLLEEGMPTILLRSVSFMIGSTLATLFALQKKRAEERFNQMKKIIQSVPAIVVASDEHGTIIAASDMAMELIEEDYKPLLGHVFTDVFMRNFHPTIANQTYRKWFRNEGVFDCDVSMPRFHVGSVPATAECSGAGQARILVVIVKKAHPQNLWVVFGSGRSPS